MSSLRILWRTIRTVSADGIFVAYFAFLAVCCLLFCLFEPQTFPTYGSAIWYCFQTITTIGFGDTVAATGFCRALTIVIGLSSLFVVALITGVVVNFFNEKIRMSRNESFIHFGHNLEHLTSLSHEELVAMEAQYRLFVKKHGNNHQDKSFDGQAKDA